MLTLSATEQVSGMLPKRINVSAKFFEEVGKRNPLRLLLIINYRRRIAMLMRATDQRIKYAPICCIERDLFDASRAIGKCHCE